MDTNSQSRFKFFQKIGLTVLIGATIAVGGYTFMEANNAATAVKTAEELVVTSASPTLSRLEKMESSNSDFYKKNSALIWSLEKDAPLLKSMKSSIDVNTLKQENELKYKTAQQTLQRDIKSTRTILEFSQLPNTEEQKKETYYYNTKDFDNFKNANSVNLVNQQELANLYATLQKHSVFVKEAKTEILKNITEKIQKKDFNLTQIKQDFQTKLLADIQEEKKSIASLKSEIEKDGDAHTGVDLTQMAEAEKSLGELETLALDQISKDEKLVSSMVSELTSKNGKISEELISGLDNEKTQTAATTHTNSGGFNFLNYYLLHQWLHSPSVGVSSGLAAGVAPSYNGSMKNSMMASQPYDLKAPGSHLNQSLSVNPAKVTPNLSYAHIQNNISKTKANFSSFQSSRTVSKPGVSVRGSSGG